MTPFSKKRSGDENLKLIFYVLPQSLLVSGKLCVNIKLQIISINTKHAQTETKQFSNIDLELALWPSAIFV